MWVSKPSDTSDMQDKYTDVKALLPKARNQLFYFKGNLGIKEKCPS